jgi:hypothetical protein
MPNLPQTPLRTTNFDATGFLFSKSNSGDHGAENSGSQSSLENPLASPECAH